LTPEEHGVLNTNAPIGAQRKWLNLAPVPSGRGFLFPLTCLVQSAFAVVLLLRFAWPALLMGAVLLGITSPGEMLGVVIGVIVLGAAALRERLPH
jgi:hypothetical protein